MVSSFATVVAFEDILDTHIDQFAGWLNGDSNYYHIANPKANDAANYLMDLQNIGSGSKALRIKDAGGNIMATFDTAGHFSMANAYAMIPATLGGAPKQGGLYRDNVTHAQAYGTMSGTALTVVSAYNCSVARASQGVFTLTFTTAPPNAKYTMLGMAGNNVLLGVESTGVGRTTASCQFAFYNTAGALTDPVTAINLLVSGGS